MIKENKMDKKELESALRLCISALAKVQSNQIYQSLHGYPDFTSAPTEYEWKRDSQRETDDLVQNALDEATIALFGKGA